MGIVRDEILPALAPGLRTSVQQVATIGGGGAQAADIQFVINGPDLTKLESISRQLWRASNRCRASSTSTRRSTSASRKSR